MSGNHRPFREDSNSYKRTGIPCGNPKRYESGAVTQMCPSVGPRPNRNVDIIEDIETEGDRQLKLLLKRQLETDVTLESQLARKKIFTEPVVTTKLGDDVGGAKSLAEFKNKAKEDQKLESFRECGLSDEEIEFKLRYETDKAIKRSGYVPDQSSVDARLKMINDKIQTHEHNLKQPVKFAVTKVMTRHEMDLELAISHDKDKTKLLGSLVSEGKSLDPSYDDSKHPINHLEDILQEALEKRRPKTEIDNSSNIKLSQEHNSGHIYGCDKEAVAEELEPMPEATCLPNPKLKKRTDKFIHVGLIVEPGISFSEDITNEHDAAAWKNITPLDSGSTDLCGNECPRRLEEDIELIPNEAILRYKVSLDEIRKLKHFTNYNPGIPHNMIFLKNLSNKVTEVDLVSIFGRYQKLKPIEYRLMSGRMKGQAFVKFDNTETAVEALELVNGYNFKGKPIIVQYGKK